jgi:hypothetical protein
MTDRTTVARIRENILQGKESVELILNYREDGAPFWNLVYICPLADARGRVRYFLGAQINVSETIGSHKDVLRALHFGSSSIPTLNLNTEASPSPRAETFNSIRRPSTTGTICQDAKARNQDLMRTKSSRRVTRSFFKFRKGPLSNDECSPTHSRSPPSRSADSAVVVGSPSTHSLHSPSSQPNLEASLNGNAFEKRLALTTQISAFRTAYSRFLLLRHTAPTSSTSTKKSSSGSGKGRLVIDYASPTALETLNLTLAAEAILGKDVFTVLAEQASCVSVTRAFKSSVRDNVLREGRSVTMDLVFSGLTGIISSGRKNSLGGEKGGRLIGYWTPIKDGVGEVCWVVLVVSPGL